MKHQYLKKVVTLKLRAEKCIGCGMCIQVCPHEVFRMNARKVEIEKKDLCMECGACARNCSASAIQVQAGVGCAAGILNGILNGTEATCGCSDSDSGCC